MSMCGAGISRTGINTADTAYFNLMGGTTNRLAIEQIIINIAVAPTTAPAFYIVRTTARGTQTSTLAGQPLDGADAGTTGTLDVCGTAGSQPTFTATNKIQTGGLAITAGGAFVWTFPQDAPLVIPATAAAGIAICNANASGASTGTWHASFLWRER
jgi:hypothetical protein